MVKEGYKQTEIGAIPEDWDCVLLLSKCNLLNGLTYTPDNVKDYGTLVVRSSNIQNNHLDFSDNVFVDLPVDEKKLIRKNDIVVCVRNGSATLIGKCAIADKDYPVTFGAFMAVLRGNHNRYLFQLLQQGTIQKHISKNSGATINQITNGDFKKILVPFPQEEKEQERIADALSDIDELISSLEKLIAKKKAIKQGTMQQLLTGKTRLPGFSEKWTRKKLAECTERIIVGLATSVTQYYRDQGTVIFRNLNILPNKLDDSDLLYLDPAFAHTYQSKKIKKDDVLTVHTGYVGISCIVPSKYEGALTFTTLITTTQKNILDSNFLSLHLNSDIGKKMIESLQAGGGRNNLNVSGFEQYIIDFPKNIEEQKEISKYLNDMGNEITALELKLIKARQIKQGMMQQLLTGRIRLM